MLEVSLDRFSSNTTKDPQDRPARYRGPYADPYDDGDWLEQMDEEKKRRFDLVDEEELAEQ